MYPFLSLSPYRCAVWPLPGSSRLWISFSEANPEPATLCTGGEEQKERDRKTEWEEAELLEQNRCNQSCFVLFIYLFINELQNRDESLKCLMTLCEPTCQTS